MDDIFESDDIRVAHNVKMIVARVGKNGVTMDADTSRSDVSSALHIWQSAFLSDPKANLLQHPDFVCSQVLHSNELGKRPLMILVAESDSGQRRLAILPPRDVDSRVLFGYLPNTDFRGYRLAGGRFFGDGDTELDNLLLKALPEVLDCYSTDLLLIEDLEDTQPLWSFSRFDGGKIKRFLPATAQKKHRIEVTNDYLEEFWANFSSKRRREFKRVLKKSEHFRVVRVTEPEQVKTFLEHAHQISLNSWQANVFGVRVRNDAAEHSLFSCLARLGYLRCYLMYDDEQPVAFEVGYQFQGYMYGVEVGFDTQFGNQSPGNVLMYRELEDLLEHDRPDWYDFGIGDAPYKQRFSNRVTSSADVWLVRGSLKNYMKLGVLQSNEKIEQGIHWALEKTRLKTRIKKLYRQFGVQRSADTASA